MGEEVDLSQSQISSATKGKRGRKKLPDCWTRVISVDGATPESIRVFELAPDLLLGAGLPGESLLECDAGSKVQRLEDAPIFFSKAFIRRHPDIKLQQFQLSGERQRQLGAQVSKARVDVLELAQVTRLRTQESGMAGKPGVLDQLAYLSRLDQKLM